MTLQAQQPQGGGVEATAREIVTHLTWLVRRLVGEIEAHTPDGKITRRWVDDAKKYAEDMETRIVQTDFLRAAPPSGLTPPSSAATAEYSAEEISRLASIRERLAKYEEWNDGVARFTNQDMAWLLARLDAHRESTARAAPEGPA